MKRATVLKPIQFLFCALLCFFGASEAHAVMTTHAQGSWVTGSKYRVGGFEAEVPGRFRESANLTPGSAIGYASCAQEIASGRLEYCNGDPINNYDPDGRFGKGAATGVVQGGFGQYDNTTQQIGGLVGQIGSYFVPGLQEYAVARDVAYSGYSASRAAYDIGQNGLNAGNGSAFAMSAVGLIPGGGAVSSAVREEAAPVMQGVENTGKMITLPALEGEIPTIGGRLPINSKLAGQTHPTGIQFNQQGFPKFSPVAKAEVQLQGLTGVYAKDAALVNQAVGLTKTPPGMVWHHVEDGVTMQLVPQNVHSAVGHTGGSAVIRNGGFD